MWIHLIQPSSQHSPFSVILLTQQVVLKEKGEISLIQQNEQGIENDFTLTGKKYLLFIRL